MFITVAANKVSTLLYKEALGESLSGSALVPRRVVRFTKLGELGEPIVGERKPCHHLLRLRIAHLSSGRANIFCEVVKLACSRIEHKLRRSNDLTHPAGVPVWVKKDYPSLRPRTQRLSK